MLPSKCRPKYHARPQIWNRVPLSGGHSRRKIKNRRRLEEQSLLIFSFNCTWLYLSFGTSSPSAFVCVRFFLALIDRLDMALFAPLFITCGESVPLPGAWLALLPLLSQPGTARERGCALQRWPINTPAGLCIRTWLAGFLQALWLLWGMCRRCTQPLGGVNPLW